MAKNQELGLAAKLALGRHEATKTNAPYTAFGFIIIENAKLLMKLGSQE